MRNIHIVGVHVPGLSFDPLAHDSAHIFGKVPQAEVVKPLVHDLCMHTDVKFLSNKLHPRSLKKNTRDATAGEDFFANNVHARTRSDVIACMSLLFGSGRSHNTLYM